MSQRFLRASASLGLALALLLISVYKWLPKLPPPARSAQAGVFEIALPDFGITPTAQTELTIPSTNVNQVEVHILRPQADRIDYGQITAKVNGEAAAGIYSTGPSERGKVVRLNLAQLPGFRLIPGRNTIEVTGINQGGRTLYASFVLSTTSNRLKEFNYQTFAGKNPQQQKPPEVALLEPEGEIVIPTGKRSIQVFISGVATAATNVARVTVGSQPVTLKRGPEVAVRKIGLPFEPNRTAFDLSYTVTAGMTRIPIEALDADGNRTQLQIPVRTGTHEAPLEFRGVKYALLVGISSFKYPGEWMQNLRFAHQDAIALREFLKTSSGGAFAPENMLLLTNEQATLSEFRRALSEFVARPKENDLLVIFLATHGGPDPTAPQNRYFILHDTQINDLAKTGLPMYDLQNYLQQNVRAKRMILLVDTCESAGLLSDPQVATRGKANNLTNLYLEKFLYREEGRAVITASDVNESSLEGLKWGGGHGVFTHFLLEGLRGKADMDADRLVTVGELFRFVRQRVRVETQFNQNPRLLIGTNDYLKVAAVTGITTGR